MALDFDNQSTTAYVDCGNAAALQDKTAFSVLVWAYPDLSPDAAVNRIWSKQPKYLAASNFTGANQLRLQVNRATTNAAAQAATNTLEVNVWQFVAATYDETDGPRIWKGKLDSAVAEVSYDGTPTVGAGATVADNTANLWWGNNSASTSLLNGFKGRLAYAAFVNKRLSSAELRQVQYDPAAWPRLADTLAFYAFGFNGTSTQPDMSGGGHSGTVTGATLAAHVPLRHPFLTQEWQPYVVAAAPPPSFTPRLTLLGVG